jgi:deoxycytidine triphosphate deaminase
MKEDLDIIHPKVVLENNWIIDCEKTPAKVSLIGLDLSVNKISMLKNKPWYNGIFTDRTKLERDSYIEILPDISGKWFLKPGRYSLELNQGINLPNNVYVQFHTRSSLVRMGGVTESGIYEPGFKTEKIGVMIYLFDCITIERNCYIGQMIFYKCFPTESYSGQWQGEKDIR